MIRRHFVAKSVWGTAIIVCFGLPFLMIGVWNGTRFASTITAYREARRWVEVPAKIIRAEMMDKDTGEGIVYWVRAEYEYDYKGQKYTGSRVSIHGGSDNIGDFWQKAYRELRECLRTGRPFRCYVNPLQPAEAVLYRDLRWEMVVYQSFLSLIFAGGGFALLIFAIFAFFAMRREERLVAAHPEEPWLWRTDWAKGEIKSPEKTSVASSIFFTAVVYLFMIPFVLLLFDDAVNKHNWQAILVMSFVAVFFTIIAWPITMILRWRKYGQSVFKMASLPGVIGGELAGAIHTAVKVHPKNGFRLTLACFQTAGKHDSDVEKTIWQNEQIVEQESFQNEERSVIQVLFAIPEKCQSSNSDLKTSWRLKVKAEVSGIDYRAEFEVPVFRLAGETTVG